MLVVVFATVLIRCSYMESIPLQCQPKLAQPLQTTSSTGAEQRAHKHHDPLRGSPFYFHEGGRTFTQFGARGKSESSSDTTTAPPAPTYTQGLVGLS